MPDQLGTRQPCPCYEPPSGAYVLAPRRTGETGDWTQWLETHGSLGAAVLDSLKVPESARDHVRDYADQLQRRHPELIPALHEALQAAAAASDQPRVLFHLDTDGELIADRHAAGGAVDIRLPALG